MKIVFFTIVTAIKIKHGVLAELKFEAGVGAGLSCEQGVNVLSDSLVLIEHDSICKLGDSEPFLVRKQDVESGIIEIQLELDSYNSTFIVAIVLILLTLRSFNHQNGSDMFGLKKVGKKNTYPLINVVFNDGRTPLRKRNRREFFDDADLINIALHPDVAHVVHMDDDIHYDPSSCWSSSTMESH